MTELKTVFVLVMRRTGSSMVLGILEILGLDLGVIIHPPDKYNEKGYFEDESVLKVKRWLYEHGLDLLKVPLKSKKWKVPERLLDNVRASFKGNFRAIKVRRELAEILKPFSGKIYCIILLREPKAQITSTKRFFENKSLQYRDYWQYYAERVYDDFRWALENDYPLLVLNYDLLLNKPREEIERIVAFLDLKVDQSRIQEAVEFIDKGLKHY